MKAIKYIGIFILSLAALSLTSCVEEDFKPGDPDRLDCQGLYFPQKQAVHYEIAPSGKMELSFTAERAVYDEEAFVPYEMTCSHEGIFEMEDEEFLYFDEDARRTTFKIAISDDFELGETYTCTIKVTDPQFVSSYSLSSNVLTFTVSVVDWVRVKSPDKTLDMGTWRDDFFSSLSIMVGAEPKSPYLEKEVEVYERSDKPGYFRVDNIYTADYISEIHAGDDSMEKDLADYCPAESIIIDATDPEKVYINTQFAFYNPYEFTSGVAGADVYMCSDVEEVFTSGYSNLYGTYKNGVIEFPARSLVIYMPVGVAVYGNTSGKTRLVLPGYKGYDYGISINVSPSEEGVMPMKFVLDADVASVKYQVFDGHLSDVEMVSKLDETKKSGVSKTVTEAGSLTFDFTAEETGLYTVIACTYDAQGNFHKYAYEHFGYDTADDPKEVDIHMGLIVSDKHAGAGHTSENAMEYYVYGKDITEAKVALYKTIHYEDFRENIDREFEYFIPVLDDYQLEDLNSEGYTGLVTNLTPGTEYLLVVYASNGYHSGFFTAKATTEGEFVLMESEFSVYDLPIRLQPETDNHDPYIGDWEVWSVDPYNAKEWGRTKGAAVEIVDKKDVYYDENGEETRYPEKAEITIDYLSLKGMHPTLAKKGLKDAIDLEFYEGFVYTLMTQMPSMKWEGKTVYPTNYYLYYYGNSRFYWNVENGAMLGGFLTEDKDVIAFVANPSSSTSQYGFTCYTMQLCYFSDETYSSEPEPFEEDAHAYPLLVKPGSEYAGYTPEEKSALKLPASCERVYAELQKGPGNYVETPRGYIMSTIDRIKSAPYNYLQNSIDVKVDLEHKVASFSMTESSAEVVAAPAEIVYLERELR